MEPNRCSVLVVDRSCIEQKYQPSDSVNLCSSNSFKAPSGDRCTCEVNNNQDIDALIKTFLTIFAEVITVPSGTKALSELKNRKVGCPPTIILIDIDHTESISRDTYARRESFLAMTDGVSLAEIHTTKDTLYGLELLRYITLEISRGALEQVIPIVCSFNENSEFMLDCLKKGAADYLLKPIRPEVAKTMFLHIHRLEYPRHLIRRSLNFRERLDEIFVKDKWLNDTIIQYYTPLSSIDLSYFPRLNSAAEIERTNQLKKMLTEWEFDSHNLSDDDLLRCVVIIFEHAMELDELKDLNVSTEQLHRFLLAIRQAYHDSNPYHNFTHAVDVLQAMFYFLCEMDLIPTFFSVGYKRRGNSCNQQRYRPNDLLRDSDAFALLLASIGHDVGHPGVNNGFLVNTRTPLAQIYNDKSVLENFHVMTLFNLMQKYGFKIYDNCLKYSEFRKVVVNAILATDMQLHFNYVKDIKGQRLRFESPNFELSKVEEEKSIIVGALIKCADISNTARPYHIAESWSNVLLQECSCQGDLERKLGIPVGPLNDRNTSQTDSQIDFINACAMPLFQSVSELIPEMNFTVTFLESNRKTWSDKKKNAGTDNRPSRHNSSGNDSGVIVSLDSRQNSPIVAVPAARIMQHQSSLSYLRPIPNLLDGPGSEAHSDVLSTTGASDAPIIQQTGGHSRRRSIIATMKQALAYYAVAFNNRSICKACLLKVLDSYLNPYFITALFVPPTIYFPEHQLESSGKMFQE
ncbi:11358_t:CDS:10 [Funneliformis caledonium]|uniref:Phosphodiesterase n=1 Tax=Funneliformis caledonium TaxID=1117310 RepID=A0A9N9BN42_9GLOM|nr:11358_t:CDS:10 [Funneliformis caledonium]